MEEHTLPKFDYYINESDPDIVILRRQGGMFVAAFSARGATKEGLLEAAKEDYGRLMEANADLWALEETATERGALELGTPLFTGVRGETVRKALYWPISCSVHRPNSRSEPCAYRFSDSLGREILGSSCLLGGRCAIGEMSLLASPYPEVTVVPAGTAASLLTLAASRRPGEGPLSFLPGTVPRRVPLPGSRAPRPLPS